ncbi:transposase [Arthrobacter sp. Y81]|uniref:IS110 family transposase n=1 Tax=Arthrobacter sp. Y81 TaxID=2058897 RepID=UPI0011B0C344
MRSYLPSLVPPGGVRWLSNGYWLVWCLPAGWLPALLDVTPAASAISRAIAWTKRNTNANVLAAVEGTSSYGAGLSRALRTSGIPVAEVKPPHRQARAGVGKSDPIDAVEAARQVLHRRRGPSRGTARRRAPGRPSRAVDRPGFLPGDLLVYRGGGVLAPAGDHRDLGPGEGLAGIDAEVGGAHQRVEGVVVCGVPGIQSPPIRSEAAFAAPAGVSRCPRPPGTPSGTA